MSLSLISTRYFNVFAFSFLSRFLTTSYMLLLTTIVIVILFLVAGYIVNNYLTLIVILCKDFLNRLNFMYAVTNKR